MRIITYIGDISVLVHSISGYFTFSQEKTVATDKTRTLLGKIAGFFLIASSLLFLFPASATAADKLLYLYTNMDLSRVVPGAQADVTIDEGISVDWTITPALAGALTVDGTSGQIPVTLVLSQGGGGPDRDFTISVTSSDGAIGTFATLDVANQVLPTTQTYNLNLTSPGDKILPISSTIILTINNTSTGGGNRQVIVTPNGSFVNLPSNTVINVDSVQMYDAAYPGGSLITAAGPGATVYARAVVSDPFGSYDVSGATVTITDPTTTVVVNAAAMTEVNDSGGATKTYEYSYTFPSPATVGNWEVQVTANEGAEGTITHTAIGFIVQQSPNITILKMASGTPSPGNTLEYTITVINTGTGQAANVVVSDILGEFVEFRVGTYAGSNFQFTDSGSGLTVGTTDFYNKITSSWSYTPVGVYDGNVGQFQIDMNGNMNGDSSFTIKYQLRIE